MAPLITVFLMFWDHQAAAVQRKVRGESWLRALQILTKQRHHDAWKATLSPGQNLGATLLEEGLPGFVGLIHAACWVLANRYVVTWLQKIFATIKNHRRILGVVSSFGLSSWLCINLSRAAKSPHRPLEKDSTWAPVRHPRLHPPGSPLFIAGTAPAPCILEVECTRVYKGLFKGLEGAVTMRYCLYCLATEKYKG